MLCRQVRKIEQAGLEGPAEWLKAELGRENRACPWRACCCRNTLDETPAPPSLEPNVKADEVHLLAPDAEVCTSNHVLCRLSEI